MALTICGNIQCNLRVDQMSEKRQAPRQKSFLRGLVYFSNSPSGTDCLVRDISESGARLKFSAPPTATENLELHIPVKGQTLHARVQWRDGDEIGIAFITDAAMDRSHSKGDELSIRVSKLEAEIASLKQLIKRLQKNNGNISDVA